MGLNNFKILCRNLLLNKPHFEWGCEGNFYYRKTWNLSDTKCPQISTFVAYVPSFMRGHARRTVEKYTTLEYVCPNTRANKMLNIQRNNVMYFAHIYIFQYIWYIKLILIKWAIQVCVVSSCIIICYKVIATCHENRPNALILRVCLSPKFYGIWGHICSFQT